MIFGEPKLLSNPNVHGRDEGAERVAFSSDGAHLMVAGRQGAFIDPKTGLQQHRLNHCEWTRYLTWYEDGFISVDRSAFRTDPTTNTHTRLKAGQSKGHTFAVGGGYLWLGQDSSPAGLSGLDLQADGKRLRVSKQPFPIESLAWSETHGLIVVGKHQIRRLDAKRKVLKEAHFPGQTFGGCVVVGDELWVSADGLTRIDLATLQVTAHHPAVGVHTLAACGTLLATQSGTTLWLFDTRTGSVLDTLELASHQPAARKRSLALTTHGLAVTYPALRYLPIA